MNKNKKVRLNTKATLISVFKNSLKILRDNEG